MLKSWYMKGSIYHELKKEFKKIREAANFQWLGVNASAWTSGRERIELVANRTIDPETNKEYTVDAYVLWKGPNASNTLKGLIKLFEGFEKAFDPSVFKQEKRYDPLAACKKYRQDIETFLRDMRARGRPEKEIHAEERLAYFRGILRFGYTCGHCSKFWKPDNFLEKCPKCGGSIE